MPKKFYFYLFIFLIVPYMWVLNGYAQNHTSSPKEFLGYELGQQFTPHHRVLSYVAHIADKNEHMKLTHYGKSIEGRELVYIIITSPNNINQIELIRKNHLSHIGFTHDNSLIEKRSDSISIVWLSFNIHGDESSSSEAAMNVLYRLSHSGDPEIGHWLENTVVIIDPMVNPDGRDRYVHWYNQTVGRTYNTLAGAREHYQPWPGGRTNHYYFDLNRDWLWQVQQESKYRADIYTQWMPHIHVDYHEQSYDSPYYFAPAAEPIHEVFTDWQKKFQQIVGRNHARYFDEKGWLYFTREIFDLFYPSYGDTWPALQGAIGMTYEQAGGGFSGLGIDLPNNGNLSLKDRIDHHSTTALSTIEVASQYAKELIDNQVAFFTNYNNPERGNYRSFVIRKNQSSQKLHSLKTQLNRWKIKFEQSTERQLKTGFSYQTRKVGRFFVEKGDIIISTKQPQGILVRALFGPVQSLSTPLTYDIVAWELPYSYGLEAYAIEEELNTLLIDSQSKERKILAKDIIESSYAILMPWVGNESMKALAFFKTHDVEVIFNEKPFTYDKKEYTQGTIIIPIRHKNQNKEVVSIIIEAQNLFFIDLKFMKNSWISSGPDIGSSSMKWIKKVKVAILTDEQISAYSIGELWFFFDSILQYPVTLMKKDQINSVSLSKYHVLILPSGQLDNVFDDKKANIVQEWVYGGGHLVAIEKANQYLSDWDVVNLEMNLSKKQEEKNNASLSPLHARYIDRELESVKHYLSGSIFANEMDNSHPLGFGYSNQYASLKVSSTLYKPYTKHQKDSWNVGVLDKLLSGHVSKNMEEKLDNSLTFGVQYYGDGVFIHLIDNPLFRGFWYSGHLLIANSLFFVGQ